MKILYMTFIAILSLSACREQKKEDMGQTENPLLNAFDTPYGVPPFDKIKDEHFKPAIEAAIALHKQEIDAIAENTEAPDFENTIVAMDKSGELLTGVELIFYNLINANTNERLEKISEETAPLFSKHQDYISLNEKLFKRVKSVWDNREKLNLDGEQFKLLEKTYQGFIRNGALLSEEDKKRITKINEELSLLALKFGQNTLAEVNEFKLVVDNKAELAGLSEAQITAAAAAAVESGDKGKWVFTLQNPSVMPFLQYAENRDLRKKIWEGMQLKGNNNNKNDNKTIIQKITDLRMQRAKMLGYANHAAYVLEDQMAKNPANVQTLLDKLWQPALNKAKQEALQMQEYINKQRGRFELQAYDWRFYAEKIRKEKFDLDENELKPYFSLQEVQNGVFTVVNKLFGLSFTERKDIPTYHPEAIPYEVKDADGSFVGVLYMDFFPRASKRGGAWMTSFRDQKMEDGKRISPVISIVCNFTPPAGDTPSLLTYDEVTTFFHEFGHALHGLLSDVNYISLAGTNVPTDFVELPSQIMENWAAEPEVLKLFAKHYKTGEVIPDALIKKIKNAGTYGQGFATTEYLAASLLDMDYHTLSEPLKTGVEAFEKSSMQSKGLIEEIIPRYRSTYFNHIFSGGYSAGYYSYIWSEVLDSDAFEAFKEKGLFDPKTATSFRKNILERGGTGDPMEMYKKFRGKEPDIKPLLKKRGLVQNTL